MFKFLRSVPVFFKRVPDALAFLIVVLLMALFSLADLPDSWPVEFPETLADLLALFSRNDSLPGGQNFYLFFGIVAVVLIALPSGILLISRYFTGSLERAGLWLRFFWASFAAALFMLVMKVIVYDDILSELHLFSRFEGGLKDIFSFSLTLYAFVAGFILFYCLQEYSSISKDFKQELGAWHAMFDLLRFFQKREGEKVKKGNEDSVKENHRAARDGRQQIVSITPKEMTSDGDPEESLNKVFGTLLRLKVLDDNDQPALDALIQKYSVLRVLLHQRKEKSVKSPSMLVFVVWVVAIINIFLASLAVLSLFEFCHPKNFEIVDTFDSQNLGAILPAEFHELSKCENGAVQALQRLVLSIFISAIVLPIMMINLTIYDLRNPFEGDWKIDVENEYGVMLARLKATLSDLDHKVQAEEGTTPET